MTQGVSSYFQTQQKGDVTLFENKKKNPLRHKDKVDKIKSEVKEWSCTEFLAKVFHLSISKSREKSFDPLTSTKHFPPHIRSSLDGYLLFLVTKSFFNPLRWLCRCENPCRSAAVCGSFRAASYPSGTTFRAS